MATTSLRPAVRLTRSTGRLLAWALVVAGLMTSFAVGHLAGASTQQLPAIELLPAPEVMMTVPAQPMPPCPKLVR